MPGSFSESRYSGGPGSQRERGSDRLMPPDAVPGVPDMISPYPGRSVRGGYPGSPGPGDIVRTPGTFRSMEMPDAPMDSPTQRGRTETRSLDATRENSKSPGIIGKLKGGIEQTLHSGRKEKAGGEEKETPRVRRPDSRDTAGDEPGSPVSAAPGGHKPVIISAPTHSPLENNLSKLNPGTRSSTKASEVCGQLRNSSNRIQDLMEKKEFATIANETDAIRSHASSLKSVGNLTLEQRLKVSSIARMYDEGVSLIDEGQATGEEVKIRLGLEKVDEANRQLNRISNE
jgi:hypothetical protein